MGQQTEKPLYPPFSVSPLLSFIFRLVYWWGPPLCWMAGIFYFSSRSQPMGPVSRSGYGGTIGNIAHIVEYAGLALLLHRAWSNENTKSRAQLSNEQSNHSNPSGSFGFPLVIAFAYAVSDELHQTFVPGRGFEVTDLALDLAGVLVALGLIWVWSTRAQNRGEEVGRASARNPEFANSIIRFRSSNSPMP